MDKHVFFQPTFGNRPESIVGRESEIAHFVDGLAEPIGSRDRCTLFLGQRGMGKTALLLELADRATTAGFVVARVTAHEGMPGAIIEQVQLNGAPYFAEDKRHLTGVSAGALGFTVGLNFSEATQRQYGFRTKMSLLCDKLAEKGKGILILIDEVHSSAAMREVGASYQELIGDGKNIAMGMAGLPYAVSGVLNDKVLTFLNRARKVELGAISIPAIEAYFERAFTELDIKHDGKRILEAAEMTRGIPYLMQLIGYYLVQYSRGAGAIEEEVLEKAGSAALRDLEDNVFAPILTPLSDNDRIFLQTMAEIGDHVSTSDLLKNLGEHGPALQPYRKRLIEAGVLEAPRRGKLSFAVPYLAEYLRLSVN